MSTADTQNDYQCPECTGDGTDCNPYHIACSRQHPAPFRDADGYYEKRYVEGQS